MYWLNQNLILSSRTVLDTMYRGAGIAYRFKNIGYRMMGFRYVESRSSMSRYNPFSVKAGMRFVAPKSAPAFETGLGFFAKWFKSPAYDYVALKKELEAMPEFLRERTLKALRDFYYQNSSMEKSGDNRLNGTSRVEQDGDRLPAQADAAARLRRHRLRDLEEPRLGREPECKMRRCRSASRCSRSTTKRPTSRCGSICWPTRRQSSESTGSW
jgi:hypothetical protein